MSKRYVLFALFITLLSLTYACQKNPFESSRRESILEREREEGREGEEHEDSFYAERAYPANTIPFGARVKAIEQADTEELRMRRIPKYAREFAQLESVSDEGWTVLGPNPLRASPGDTAINYSGRVSALALHPQYDGSGNQTIYVGGAQGGVWRSTNNGQNWTPIMDDQPSLAIGSIAIDPTNPNNIFIGTGEGNRSGDTYYGAGILKSTDGGATWRVISGPLSTIAPLKPVFVNAAIPAIVVDPVTPNVMFAATTSASTASASGGAAAVESNKQKGVWRSTDSGETWSNVDPDGSAGVQSAHDVLVDPVNHNTVYAAVRTRGIYRSKSGGAAGTWEKLTNGIANSTAANATFLRCNIVSGPALAPSTSTTLYASFSANTSAELVLGIYRSTDSGDSWTQVTTPATGGQAAYNTAMAVDPVDANTVYYGGQFNYSLGTNEVMRSKDGGVTWVDMNSLNLHPDTHVLVVAKNNRNIIFTGNDGGIWRCDAALAGSVNWTTLNTELSLTQLQSIALHPTDSNLIIGGSQDNGTHIFKGSRTWDVSDDGDGGFSLIDQSNPLEMYHTYYNQSGSSAQIGPAFSSNGGVTWPSFRGCSSCRAAQGKINPNDRPKFYAPMALNPAFTSSTGNVIYFGTQRLYRTNDKGVSWFGLGASTDGYGADLTNGGSLTAIAVYPKIDSASPPTEIVWTGSTDGVIQVTSSAGAGTAATFTNTTKAPLPNRYITDIAADINNPDRAVVVFSGFNENTIATPGHIFITTNRGNTWTDISGNLPDVPTTSISLDPNNNNRIWAGTDIGVFQTTDGGVTWIRMSKGMPKVAVFMLRYHVPTGNLIAATHGRGVYRWRTNTTATSVSAASYAPTADNARNSIVAAFGLNLATAAAPAPAGVLPLPTTLAGTMVTIRDSQNVERLASLFYAGSGQVNYQIPDTAALGTATVIVKNSLGETSSGTINITAVAPGLFTGNNDGAGAINGFAIRVRGASQTRESTVALNAINIYVTKPISFDPAIESLFLELYGTGIRYATSQANVQCEIGGVTIPVEYAGVAPGYIGLDQVNIKIPNSLDNRGEVDLTLIVDGKRSRTVKVNIN